MKPRITVDMWQQYTCFGFGGTGWGWSPKEAYDKWKADLLSQAEAIVEMRKARGRK